MKTFIHPRSVTDNEVTNLKRLISLDKEAIKVLIPEDGPRLDFTFNLNLYKKVSHCIALAK